MAASPRILITAADDGLRELLQDILSDRADTIAAADALSSFPNVPRWSQTIRDVTTSVGAFQFGRQIPSEWI